MGGRWLTDLLGEHPGEVPGAQRSAAGQVDDRMSVTGRRFDGLRVDVDRRERGSQLGGERPGGGDAVAVKQTGLGGQQLGSAGENVEGSDDVVGLHARIGDDHDRPSHVFNRGPRRPWRPRLNPTDQDSVS